jgi:hypothetical protein
MLVLEVYVNGRRIARAGAADLSVLGVHITGVGKLGHASRGSRFEKEAYDVDLGIGGLTSRGRTKRNEHLRWGSRRALKLGDEVLVRIVDSRVPDKPTGATLAEESRPKVTERQFFLRSKEVYFRLRGKYEKGRLTSRSTRTRRKRRAG